MKTCDCGELDPVARRIMLAKRVRQAEYEREVVVRASKRCFEPAPPVPGFSLGAERECARATDGCTYTMRAVHAPRTRCGPGRTPPPPRCVELVPDDGCRIRGDSHLDPCAHRPRVMIEIDRSVNTDISLKRPSADHSPSKPMPGPGSGPRPCPVGKARVVPKWCADPPRPAPSPPCCRRPSLVERLRARSASCPPDPRCKRRLHTTSVVLGKTSKPVPSNSSGLDAILQNKKNLKEAGIGRFVKDECGQAAPSRQRAPAGKLELRLPPGTERVAVHVSLHGSTPSTCATTSPPVTSSATSCIEPPSNSCNKLRETCEKQNSWLSIKNIKKNISGCRLEEESPMTRVPAAGRCAGPRRPAIAPRCGPAAPPEPAAPRRCSSTSAYIANTVIVDSF
ncbi:uncharacterized protein LOC113501273 [Trichoplusia ni]|uniref:Uncharacterized protein LOC113501273 n=1 Tax=Trichoplusia ni TaxID=7111 RepID=A0A7E5WBS0_TRINI|nr:uncharacterized protein LOC113501273 [Trichoplusia ni]